MSASHLEEALLGQIRDAGLPDPEREAKFGRFRWDFYWGSLKLAVEVEGGTAGRARKVGDRWYTPISAHNSVTGIDRDCRKGNEAVLQGIKLLRVTTKMIEDGSAIQLIRRAIEGEGNGA